MCLDGWNQKRQKITSVGEDVDEKIPSCTAGGRQAGAALWKILWRFLKKLKVELPYDPVIPWLCVYPKKMKTPICKDICTPVLIAALFTIAKIWGPPKCPLTDRWIKMGCILQWTITQP